VLHPTRSVAWATILALTALSTAGSVVSQKAAVVSNERREQDRQRVAETKPSGVKVFVVGIDGGTFRVLDPLLNAGDLPTFRKLIDQGTRSVLRSRKPSISPVIWTTIVTSLEPEQHGITDFVLEDEETGEWNLVSTRDRKTHATWTIANAFGLKNGLSGWWATWPPEPVKGFVISDRVAQGRHLQWSGAATREHLTHPDDLARQIRSVFCDPRDPPMQELLQLASFNEEEQREIREAERPLMHHAPSIVKTGWCEQRTYEEMMLKALRRYGQPDLVHLLLIATDPISHTTWHWYEPDAYAEGVDPDYAERLGTIVPGIYRHNDQTLKRLMAITDRNTAFLVISDHGFRASGQLPGETIIGRAGHRETILLDKPVTVGQSGVHDLDGILIAAGGPIVEGATFTEPPTIMDIAPTVLVLMGLPVAEDMLGRVLTEMIDPAFLEKHPIRTVASYEGLIERPEPLGSDVGLDEKRTEYLRSLGYIE
jgi:predicted AlkP superfamily phosphohydrolase/phosphomutase